MTRGQGDAVIARLRGTVLEAYPNRLIVDVHGVGYEVLVPLSTFDRLHAAEGLSVDLRTHLHVRETAHTLYGFASEEERDVFLLLIDRVSGIGPAIAMAVLSGMPVPQFKSGVVQGDVAALSRIKGVGKKTAERIILELKDKVGVTETWQDAAAGQVSAPAADAELALIALGYKQVDARKAVRKALDLDPAAATEALVRGALRLLQN
ncbi:MAG TPA: Holliday junction branch migration protein RuvA [Luteolibacter sp.]|jgi:Holliday junction DNA helicase RuvA